MSSGILSLIVRSSRTARRGQGSPLLCLVLIGLSPYFSASQIVVPGDGSPLNGRVVNARTGAPMARVLVQANGVTLFTNAEGRFTLSGVSGVTSLRLTKPGFSLSPEQRDPETLNFDPAFTPVTLDVELWPEAVLAGTVTSPEGEALPHLSVAAERVLFQNGLRQIVPVLSTVTDAHGSFRMPVPAGNYILRTQYVPPDFTRSLAVLPTQRPAPIANDATGTIHIASGEELHFDLHPAMAAVFQTTMPLQGDSGQRYPSINLTNSEGLSFQPPVRVTPEGVVLTLPAGSYQVSARLASPEGQLFGHQVLTVPEEDSTSAPLRFETLPAIPIAVSIDPASISNPDGSPLVTPDGGALNLQLEPDSGSAFAGIGPTIRSNRRAAGSSFLVPPGTYRLARGETSGWSLQSASIGGVDLLRNPIVVSTSASSEPIQIVVTHPSGSLSGVTRIGGFAARCWIVLVPEADTLPRFFVRRSGMNGVFQISNLPLRSFRLLALPLLSSADFGQPAELDHFPAYVQTIRVTSSSSASLTLDAVPMHELYP